MARAVEGYGRSKIEEPLLLILIRVDNVYIAVLVAFLQIGSLIIHTQPIKHHASCHNTKLIFLHDDEQIHVQTPLQSS